MSGIAQLFKIRCRVLRDTRPEPMVGVDHFAAQLLMTSETADDGLYLPDHRYRSFGDGGGVQRCAI